MILGAAPAVAQSGGAGAGNYGAGSSAASGTTGSAANESAQNKNPLSPSQSGNYGTDAGASGSAPSANAAAGSTAAGSAIGSDTSTAGGATTMTGRDSRSSGKLGWMEKRFVTKAADAGMTEMHLAKLATERATNPEVKSYAQMLVDDHQKVADELKTLASQKNVTLDADDLGSDRAHKRLSKKTGMDFDQEFVDHMVDMHESDVKMFEKAAEDAKDQDLRSFAAKHVGALRQHLQQAQSLRSSIMPTGRDSWSSGSHDGATGTSRSTGSSTSSGTTGSSATPDLSGGLGTSSSSGSGTSRDANRADPR